MTLASDFSGIDDIDYALSTVDGRTALAQAILRRLTTPRGDLITDPQYGYNVRDLIGSHITAGVVKQRVTEQCFAEEEVQDASCTVALTAEGMLQIFISIVDGEGPFRLTINSTELTLDALMNDSVFWSSNG